MSILPGNPSVCSFKTFFVHLIFFQTIQSPKSYFQKDPIHERNCLGEKGKLKL
jgi:hypothetical protein